MNEKNPSADYKKEVHELFSDSTSHARTAFKLMYSTSHQSYFNLSDSYMKWALFCKDNGEDNLYDEKMIEAKKWIEEGVKVIVRKNDKGCDLNGVSGGNLLVKIFSLSKDDEVR